MPYLLSCDIHTHTMFSAHAYSTIEENVYWAAERGLQVLGSADHLSSMVTPCPDDLRSYQFFINQDIWPRIWSGVLVLRGAEADIVSLDGSLFGEDTPVTLDIAGDSYSRQHSLFDLATRIFIVRIAFSSRKTTSSQPHNGTDNGAWHNTKPRFT